MKTSELCPQALLDEEYYPGNYNLEDLSFKQLVAGELEICTLPDIAKTEKRTRLKILKLMAYFSNTLPQKNIMEIYKAVILKVEKGQFRWSGELISKVESMLDRAVSKNRLKKDMDRRETTQEKAKTKKDNGVQVKSGEKVIYCLDYNKRKCDKDHAHEGKFAGREVWKQHICRICLTVDKEKRSHPEGDENCPNKTK